MRGERCRGIKKRPGRNRDVLKMLKKASYLASSFLPADFQPEMPAERCLMLV